MTERSAVLIRIGEAGVTVRLPGGEEARLAFGSDRDEWHALRGQLASHQTVTTVVPAAATFDLRLPELPRTRRRLRQVVAEIAPVVPGQLVWTRPRQLGPGQPAVTVVRRTWLDERVGLLEGATDLVLEPVAEHNLSPFLYRSPAARHRMTITLAILALPLVALALLRFAPVWREGKTAAVHSAPAGPVAEVFASPSLAATVTALAARLPRNTAFAAMGRDRSGVTTVEADTPDPDLLRTALGGRDLAPGLSDSGRARLMGKVFRLTFGGLLSLPSSSAAESAPPLAAPTAEAAGLAAADHLRALAKGAALELKVRRGEVAPGRVTLGLAVTGPQATVLSFADRLESSQPVMRFSEWRLVPDAAGVRLSGTVVVPWFRAT